jgi:hypothetical protein
MDGASKSEYGSETGTTAETPAGAAMEQWGAIGVGHMGDPIWVEFPATGRIPNDDPRFFKGELRELLDYDPVPGGSGSYQYQLYKNKTTGELRGCMWYQGQYIW